MTDPLDPKTCPNLVVRYSVFLFIETKARNFFRVSGNQLSFKFQTLWQCKGLDFSYQKLLKSSTYYCVENINNKGCYCQHSQGLLVMAGNVTNQQTLPMTVGIPTDYSRQFDKQYLKRRFIAVGIFSDIEFQREKQNITIE